MMKFYNYFIKFFCLFVPSRNRRKTREELLLLPHIFEKNKKSKPYFKKFLVDTVKERSVLIVEPNPYHFELQPGYCRYFQDLDYKVDVIAQPDLRDDSSYINHPDVPDIYYLSPKYQKKALSQTKIKDYDFVFFSTSVLWADNVRDSYINWLGFEPKAKHGILLVEHNIIPYLEEYGHQKYVDQRRSFSIAGQYDIPILNPHYFGNVRITDKSTKTVFSAVVKEQKNVDLLIKTCKELISSGIGNFEIIVTGRTALKKVPEDLKEIIKFTGKTTFAQLWETYERADFIIPMLNPEIGGHKRYKNGTATGSWQTMLGFQKPMVVHSEFTDSYRLNESNAIIFRENSDLSKALQHCIDMRNDGYIKLQENIRILAEKIYVESLENLKSNINHQN